MKMIMVTAPSSGSGKTLVTLGIIRALKKKGMNICGYKTGPDYIDTKFLGKASGKRPGNLDIHLMGVDGIKKAIAMGEGEYAVVEGAMGYFDGIYNTFENSSFQISNKLDINSILVYTPKGEMFSAIPKIKGMVDFEGSKIKGVILNKVNKSMYMLLKSQIEKYIGIKVLGFIEEDKALEIESRHLGLIQTEELENIEHTIEKASTIIEENIDIEEIIKLMKEVKTPRFIYPEKRNIKIAIAYDKAFSFYYMENLKLLEKTCNVEYFSPLEDEKLPICDLVYIGGGYPEIFKDELSKNKSMLISIRDFVEKDGYIYGESGGFLYLLENIEGSKMCNVLKGNGTMTDKLERFGYINVELLKDCVLGRKGDILTGHEFHKTTVDIDDEDIYNITKPMSKKTWRCGHTYKNVLGGYPHINFLGNMESFNWLMDKVENSRER
ncbi:cobyrinate a,c-diamide synthase [Anaerosalibacter massiliensis]|uniref:Cobyrinate a,c-diamide synthase n=1 Tax=Anaerosalibacter massiliensis TaxID=1347392 RepID=A0A9X2MF63_9FIRM|nr:cobyrinate a,c-diamide synthase [Anaerosalibacter massiliensis]MCR2043852.1 cobyrinate a,c-diamide synthase [Anaerosalibacter massiliensis]